MGSGCSSPLRRFAGKRAKQGQRDSVSQIIGDEDNPEQLTIAAKIQAQQQKEANLAKEQRENLNLDNEITIHSEANEEHPSSVSYCTDGKNATENGRQKLATLDQCVQDQSARGTDGMVARMMGLSGVPYDRYLLVSPALSPAPSTCQSPAPTSSYAGCPISLDLNDLDEAFMTLTFGPPDANATDRRKIKRSARATQSDLFNHYNQQLIQSREDLTQNVSVVFIASDNITENILRNSSYPSSIDLLANQLETVFRSICDDHSYNLRFLNLSQDHLSKHLFVNNLPDVARKLLEEEYKENGHRMLVIMLANSSSSQGIGGGGSHPSESVLKQQILNDKRLLPTRIDYQVMNKLLNYDQALMDQRCKDLLRLWYNQVGSNFYLKPIYLVESKISSKLKDEREQAWQRWLNDSNLVIKTLVSISENDAEIKPNLALRSLFNTYIDFVLNEVTLQRRTLLIRNYTGFTMSSQNPQQLVTSAANKLNDLARLLADPCKLTMKHSASEEEFAKSVSDWIQENFSKYLESFIENRITSGKCVPPFIEHNLFVELTRQRHYLDYYMESITENFESKCLNFYTTQVQPILSNFNDAEHETHEAPLATSLSASEQSIGSQLAANHLVFISGPKGSGKTTLFAQLVKNAVQEFSDKIQIIYRFCGLTMDSLNSNRLLRSICEQFCQVQGENTTAASYIYSSRRRELLDAIGKIVKMRSVLILIDGINMLNDSIESCLDWVCEMEANSQVKIILTLETDCELYKRILNTYTDATFISLNNPTTSEWAHMLTTSARNHRYNSSGSLYDELKELDESNSGSAQVNFDDTFDALNMCRIRIMNNEHAQPELTTKMAQLNSYQSWKNTHEVVLKYLHYVIPPYLVCSLLIALDTSRNGLSEAELIEIMSLVARKYYDTKQNLKFSASLLNYLKFQLKPWLRVIVCDRIVRLTIRRDLLKKAIDFYVPSIFPKLIGEVRDIMESFYSRPFKQLSRNSKAGLSSSDLSESSPSKIKEHVSFAEATWLEIQASELMNLFIRANPSKAKSYILNKQTFYLQFLHRSIPEEFVEDYDRLRIMSGRKLSQNEEIQNLVNYIRQSIFPLRYDGSQIYSQIYCRSFENFKSGNKSTKSKKFNEILSVSLSPPIWSLLPISEISIESFIKTRIGQLRPQASISAAQVSAAPNLLDCQRTSVQPSNQLRQPNGPVNSYQQASRQKIFTIKDNHRHVIAIYPDKNCLAVWDIYEEQAVRIINDIEHPRDLKMVDQKRAVILCNRELRVYDLDSGLLVTKLKGVMNQKMPYFEIFGQDYVIALARNRMYVNMLNINTGELETTFKVGEDRFLNSLLVSADGGICVCGDETQKPFPLLVWNLNERRLMYDLRLDRHEFITRMSAISDDGHFVVSVCKQLGDTISDSTSTSASSATSSTVTHRPAPNFIVIYDLNSGTLFKKWKPGLDTCGVAISLSSNRSGKLINSITDSSILVWDLTTGSKKHTLIGHSAPADMITVQNNRLFSMDSTCRDQSLRIWDIEQGYCLALFSPDAPVSCCQMSIKGDALICGFAAEFRLSTLVLCKNETVGEVVKRNRRRKSSRSLYIFDEPPSRKPSS